MTPRARNASLALAVLGIAGLGLVLLPPWRSEAPTFAQARAQGAAEGERDVGAELVAAEPDTAVAQREHVEGPALDVEVLAIDGEVHEAATGGPRVVCVVEPTRADEEVARFGGLDVLAQTWIAETGATALHRARIDAQGRATFVFPDFIHVDWFRFDPPPSSGLGMALDELHLDLEPGSLLTHELAVSEGGLVVGRVEGVDGRPLGGVEVHAYLEYYLATLEEDWRPGIVVARSDASGHFAFPPLPAGPSWMIGVPPFEWLQVAPSLLELESGRSYAEVEAGATTDLGTFRVTPLERLAVRVVDATGAPLPRAVVTLAPRAFADPALALGPAAEGARERFLAGLDPAVAPDPLGAHSTLWSYGEQEYRVDEQGKTRFLVPAGRYVLTALPALPLSELQNQPEPLVVEVPRGPLEVRLPLTTRAVRGRAQGLDGAPLSDVGVVLTRADANGSMREVTDENGDFRIEAVPDGEGLRLHFESPSVLPATRVLLPDAQDEAPVYTLWPAELLRVRVVNADESPLRWGGLFLLSGRVDPIDPPYGPSEREHVAKLLASGARVRLNNRGMGQLNGLAPGTYEIGLRASLPTGEYDPRGNPLFEEQLLQTWNLATGPQFQTLRIEVPLPDAPPPQRRALYEGYVREEETGLPIPGARVVLSGTGGSVASTSGPNGEYQLVVPLGPCVLEVVHPDFVTRRLHAEAQEPGRQTLDVELQPGVLLLSLVVTDAHGETLPGLTVGLRDEEGRPVFAAVSGRGGWEGDFLVEDGLLELVGVAPGRLTLRGELFGISAGSAEIAVAPAPGPQRHTVRLSESAAELRARLRDELDGVER